MRFGVPKGFFSETIIMALMGWDSLKCSLHIIWMGGISKKMELGFLLAFSFSKTPRPRRDPTKHAEVGRFCMPRTEKRGRTWTCRGEYESRLWLVSFPSSWTNTASRNFFRTLVKETMKWLCTSTGWMVRTRNFVNLPYMTVDLLMKFCCMSNHMWCHLLNHWAWTLGFDFLHRSRVLIWGRWVWYTPNEPRCGHLETAKAARVFLRKQERHNWSDLVFPTQTTSKLKITTLWWRGSNWPPRWREHHWLHMAGYNASLKTNGVMQFWRPGIPSIAASLLPEKTLLLSWKTHYEEQGFDPDLTHPNT